MFKYESEKRMLSILLALFVVIWFERPAERKICSLLHSFFIKIETNTDLHIQRWHMCIIISLERIEKNLPSQDFNGPRSAKDL